MCSLPSSAAAAAAAVIVAMPSQSAAIPVRGIRAEPQIPLSKDDDNDDDDDDGASFCDGDSVITENVELPPTYEDACNVVSA
jgi:hypothetical protein